MVRREELMGVEIEEGSLGDKDPVRGIRERRLIGTEV